MKNKKKMPDHDLDNIMPLLIQQWRRYLGIRGPEDVLQTREFRGVVKAVMDMDKNFQHKDLIDNNYFSSREHLAAYLMYYWPMHYQEGLSLINELPRPPRRVLDIGSGPAPYAFAALQHGATDVYATDLHLDAVTLGAKICGRHGKTLTVREWNCRKDQCPVEGKFDLIILAHTLEEIFPREIKGWRDDQDIFIQSLISKLTPDGYLMIVDNSRLSTNHRILEIRDSLVEQGLPVQAPCVWKGKCPALQTKNSPCYAQRDFVRPYVVKEIQRAARFKQSSLKMSYLIMGNLDAKWPLLPEKQLYRVISPPIDSFNGPAFYLCGVDGKKKLSSHIKEHSKDTRSFDYLKRGELISIEGALEEGNHLHIIEGTKVKIEAACGKSIDDVMKG
ncbi:MAG: small ribosomal subunit Rsm22 family protein [Chlamydiota bacterium]|nr:small ribosomal subunit Rsm22 family protein [Chlamydiota bacterium]